MTPSIGPTSNIGFKNFFNYACSLDKFKDYSRTDASRGTIFAYVRGKKEPIEIDAYKKPAFFGGKET